MNTNKLLWVALVLQAGIILGLWVYRSSAQQNRSICFDEQNATYVVQSSSTPIPTITRPVVTSTRTPSATATPTNTATIRPTSTTVPRVTATLTPLPSQFGFVTQTDSRVSPTSINPVFQTATDLAKTPTPEVINNLTPGVVLNPFIEVEVTSPSGVRTRTCNAFSIVACTVNPSSQWLRLGERYRINTTQPYCFAAQIGTTFYFLVLTNQGWAAYTSVSGSERFLRLLPSTKEADFLSYCLI